MERTIPVLTGNPHPLGRHVNHDERSRAFPFRAEDTTTVKSIEWTRRAAILDQGDLGSCTGNAAAGWIATDNSLRQGFVTVGSGPDNGKAVNEDLAVSIYEQATVLDPYQGQYPPDDTGSDGLSVAKVLVNLGLVDTYTHGFDFNAVLAALQVGPVLFGTNWYEGMFTPDHNDVVTVTGAVAGGHEYLCVGLDVDGTLFHRGTKMLKFANSWGTSFADAGFFYMSYATATRLLKEDGDATVPHALVAAPVPPAPPTPTPPTPTPPVPPTPEHPTWYQELVQRLEDLLKWLKSL